MGYWPVPKSYSKKIPKTGKRYGFKGKNCFINKNHKKVDIWHSGIDILCPAGSKVIAVEDCRVIRIWKFTGYSDSPEYRKTWAVTVRNKSGNIIVYGELRKLRLRLRQEMNAGQLIGFSAPVGFRRNVPDITKRCMLHFELYKRGTQKTVDWWYKDRKKPQTLLDPTEYLKNCE